MHNGGVFVGLPVDDDAEAALEWIRQGVQWLAVGGDVLFLVRAINRLVAAIARRWCPRVALRCTAYFLADASYTAWTARRALSGDIPRVEALAMASSVAFCS